ncbi:unnamed protein product [Caenorhabditis auriculariae]|uniref:Uncharacterized protein n=1 Tax=Caenorhabditis auriculariae TaxID=2777116 RepID=A0A8S1HE29_9PELO|nr:unnamed protein product [Caenorhabditis auriculariae]
MEELKKTNDELNKKISALEKTSNDLEMNQIRMNMLETRMAKLNNQLVEVTAERDNAKQSIERLEKELAQARARPVSTVSSEIHTTSAAPTASVSTSAASSAAKTLSAATSSSAASKFGQPSSAASSNSQSQQVSQVHNSSSAVPIFTDDRARVPTMPTDSVSQSLSDELLFNSQKPPLLTSTPSIPADIDQQAVGESVPELSHQQPAPPDVLSPATSLPVPGAFASSARVPAASLFSGFSHTPTQSEGVPTLPPKPTIAPPAEKPKISFASSSSLIQPGQSLFGRSAPTPEPMTTSSSSTDAVLLPEESVVEAGQSSQVSGSVDKTQHIQPLSGPSDSAGESRDSTTGPNVSSSEARRKRTATESSAGGAKRLRGSPSEDVTSSENRPIQQVDEIPELDDEVLEIEQEVSDEDRNEILRRQLHGEVVDLENEDDEEGDNGEMLDDDGQMTGEEENEEPEDDESFGGDEEYEEPDDDDDIIDETDQPRDEEEDDIVVLNDSDDNDDVDSIEDVGEEEADDLRGNDDEVLGGEDSQPSLDDQDREAASAMEEAEDEGRASVEDQLAPTDGSVAVPLQPDVPNPNLRIPQFFETDGDREDQCSSSNETAEASGSSEPAQRGRQVARRSRGRQLQIYQPPNRSVAPQSPARSRGLQKSLFGTSRPVLHASHRGNGIVLMARMVSLVLLPPLVFSVVLGDFSVSFNAFLVANYGQAIDDQLARRDLGTAGSYGGGEHTGVNRTERQAVVLVHGITNTAGTFANHRQHLLNIGWTDDTVFATTYGDGGKTVAPLVDVKCQYIKQVRYMIQVVAAFTHRKVDVIAYSLGSPIARKALLGGKCVDSGEDLGSSLTGLIDTFVSVAGANRGSFLCVLPFPGACNLINGLSCSSAFIRDINKQQRYEGKYIYSIYSKDDDKVGYRNACGQLTSSIDGADAEFERPGNHDGVIGRTAQLSALGLLRRS